MTLAIAVSLIVIERIEPKAGSMRTRACGSTTWQTVVEIARDLGAHHRLIVRDQGIDEPQEDRRVLRRGAAGLGGVGTIIAAGADDLVRVGDRRQQSDLRQRDIRRPALYLGCGGA